MTTIVVLIATTAYGSLLEWFVHAIVFHRWFAHLHLPHHAQFAGARFQQPGPYRNLQRWWLELAAVAAHAPALLVVGVWLGGLAAVTVLAVLAFYAAAANFLHTAVHCPNGRCFERTRWYRRLVARHRVHHRDARVNFTVASWLGDAVMGSLRGAAPAPGRTAMRARSSARRS